jgi:LacI family transcriptional regulator
MKSPAPTVRSIARTLGLSHTTVSDALRGKGRVDPATAARVQKAAREAGYRRNPLAAAVMSELRRSRGGTFRGVLAAVDLAEPDRAPHGIFHRELVSGGRERASELGFKLEEFLVGSGGMTVPRLDSILQSRGINGVLLLPSWYAPDSLALDRPGRLEPHTDPYAMEAEKAAAPAADGAQPVRIVPAAERVAARRERRGRTVVRLPSYETCGN